MQFLFTIKDFSFFEIPYFERVGNCLTMKTAYKELFLSNYKDFQTIAPPYLK